VIDEATVETTWQEVCGYGVEQATNEMTELGECQPHLLVFLMNQTNDFGDDVKDLAIFQLFVVYRMFARSLDRPVPEIAPDLVADRYRQARTALDNSPWSEDLLGDLESIAKKSAQMWVMKYVVDSLREAPETAEPVILDDDTTRDLFAILAAVVNTLDHVTNGQPSKTAEA
jgi:hypothetical protein